MIASELTTPVPPEIMDRLADMWLTTEPGPAGMARIVDPAVDELREAVKGGAPYQLRVVHLALLSGYYDPAVRETMAPLLSPEAVLVADMLVATLERIQHVAEQGYSFAQAALIDSVETELRGALPDAINPEGD